MSVESVEQEEIANLPSMPSVYVLATHELGLLLGSVLDCLSMMLPNKQQHAAAVHVVRSSFDRSYTRLNQAAFPDSEFGARPGGYALEPTR